MLFNVCTYRCNSLIRTYIYLGSQSLAAHNVFVNLPHPVHIFTHTHARTHTGSVLYLMSPDDPAQCVPKLVHQQKVSNSVLSGHYRVNGTQVRNSHRTHNLLEGLHLLQKQFLYLPKTFMVETLYNYNPLCFVKCSTSLSPFKAVATSFYLGIL